METFRADDARPTRAPKARAVLSWLLLILSMGASAAVVVFCASAISSGLAGAWSLPDSGAFALVVGVVCAVTAVVGPLYLLWLDILLEPRLPVFRPGFLAYVVGPAAPLALPMLPWLALNWPAYPIAYVGMPALFYVLAVAVGALIFVGLAAPLGLIAPAARRSGRDAAILLFFRAWGVLIVAATVGCGGASLLFEGAGAILPALRSGTGGDAWIRAANWAGGGFSIAATLGIVATRLRDRLVTPAWPFVRPGLAVVAAALLLVAAIPMLGGGPLAVGRAVFAELALGLTLAVYMLLAPRAGVFARPGPAAAES